MEQSITIFKAKSQKGNIYYSIVITQVLHSVTLKTSGLLYEQQALKLVASDSNIVLVDKTL